MTLIRQILSVAGKLVATFAASMLFIFPASAGYPSLDISHQYDDVVVEINGVTSRFTVIRDASLPSQWYYIPDQPRVTERDYGGKKVPEFTLVKYQTAEPDVEGGLLQISFNLAIPPEAVRQVRAQLMERTGLSDVALGPLPMNSANVYLFSSTDGTLMSNSETAKDGLAPTFATQSIAVQLELSRLGADVYDALTTETEGGVGVAVEFSYNGLTPELSCEATVKWKEMHSYFRRNQKFAASVSYANLFGAKAKGDLTKIRETLKSEGLVEMKAITGGDLTLEKCQEIVFKPLLARVAKHLLRTTSNVTALAAEAKKDSDKWQGKPKKSKLGFIKGLFGSASYSVQIVDIKTVRELSESVSFKTRQVVERKTVVSGFVGIGGYPEAVRERAVLIVSDRPWDRVLVNLPIIPLEYEVSGIDLSLVPSSEGLDVAIPDQDFRWTEASGWTNYKGERATYAYFPIADLGLPVEQRRQLPLEVSYTIVKRGQSINVKSRVLPDEENNLMDGLLNGVEAVKLIDDGITWARMNDGSGVVRIMANIMTPQGQAQLTLRPKNINGHWVIPDNQYYLIATSDEVQVNVTIRLSDGTDVAWRHNGLNLRQTPGGLDIGLDDSDWR